MDNMKILCAGNSGEMPGLANIALDRAQHAFTVKQGSPYLRFHRNRATASMGSEDHHAYAFRKDYCVRHGVDVVRRMSTGAALYLDNGQLCWTLTVAHDDLRGSLASVLKLLVLGACSGLKEIGINAVYAYPNDISVRGKKIGSVFLGEVEGIWMAHGVLIENLDVETMLKVLRVPKEKLSADGILIASKRFETIARLQPGYDRTHLQQVLEAGIASAMGMAVRLAPALEMWGDGNIQFHFESEIEDASTAFVVTQGGVIHASINLSVDGVHIKRCTLYGDIQMRPGGMLLALCSYLESCHIDAIRTCVLEYFSSTDYDMLDCDPRDIVKVLQMAAARRTHKESLKMTAEQVNTLMLYDPDGCGDVLKTLNQIDAVLVPYCAKPVWCKWRHKDGCPECGKCSVGDAYHMARQRGLPITTIQNFEHLEIVLEKFKKTGVRAYAGMCCSNFFIKRYHAFSKASIPALLMDISGANCYELRQEDLAYVGAFSAQASINIDVVGKVMAAVPTRKEITGSD